MRRFLALASTFSCAAALLLSTNEADAQGATPPPPSLAPPPPIDPNGLGAPTGDPNAPQTPEQATLYRLDEAEKEDSGRNFEFVYVDTSLGASYINMSQFSSDTLQIEKASSAGPMISLGAGIRLVVFVLGVRAKYNALSAFNMWQLNGEVGFKVPIHRMDFLFGLHGGYSFVGSIGDGTVTNTNTPTSNDAVKIRGFNAGIDIALDYYITPLFSLGAGVLADGLFLKRPPVEVSASAGLSADQQAAIANDPLYQKSGSSAGFQLAGGLRAGLHFGL